LKFAQSLDYPTNARHKICRVTRN